jgi:hypothetical protein
MEKPPATKKPSKKPRAPNRRPTQNFADIARILAVSDAPPWLPGFLEWWSQGVRHDILVDEYRPSKLKTVKRLLGVEQAVALLQRELENPSIRNMLEAARKPGRIRVAIADLKDLSARAEIARSSTELVGKSGSTKRGPGKPDVPDVFNAKAICAARIFEAWRLLNGRELLCVECLSLTRVLRPERKLLFPFAFKDSAQVIWDGLAKPVHSGAGMLPRTRYWQDHFVPLHCTNGALQKSLFLRNTRQIRAF